MINKILHSKYINWIFYKFYGCTILLFGIFSILEVFKYRFGGISIYFADAFYYLYAILNLVIISFNHRNEYLVNNQYKSIWLSFIFLLIGSLNIWSPIIDDSLYFNNPKGSENAVKYAIKTIILIIVLWSIIKLPKEYRILSYQCYIKGFIIGVFIHAYYSVFQAVMWYLYQTDIHTTFLNSMGVTEESVGHGLVNFLILPVIRSSGLHWDPAYFGLWGAIVILLIYYKPQTSKRHKILYNITIIILILSWILSFSRTGYFALIMALIVMQICSHYNCSIRRIRMLQLVKISVSISIISLSIYASLPSDTQSNLIKGFAYRFTHNENDEGSVRHIMYPLYTLEGITHDPLHFIFGYGARNSSRAILFGGNLKEFTSTEITFDIESDFCKMLANYGIVYFIIYLYFNYKIVKLYVKTENFQYSYNIFLITSVISIFFSGIFYIYNDSKWVWFIYIFSLINLTNHNSGIHINENRCLDHHR